MKTLSKEIAIFFGVFLLSYISHKLDCYDTMIVYLLVRIWFNQEWGDWGD